MARAYARAAASQRAVGKVPWGHWKRLTVLGALALDGVVVGMSIAAATGTAVFLAFVEQVLIPTLLQRPDAIVVMDNLAAHKAKAVQRALDRAGISYRYLRPTLPISTRSSRPGRSSRPTCAPRRPGAWRRLRPSSAQPSTPSPPTTPRAGSASPAMQLLTDLKAALVRMLRGGQITLAAEARRALKLSDGASLDLQVRNGAATLKSVEVVNSAEVDRQLDAIFELGALHRSGAQAFTRRTHGHGGRGDRYAARRA